MFKFAIKNLLTRKSKSIITIVAIFISAMIILFSYNVSNQINDGMISTASYYDIVVGPNGSSTDLVLSAMFFTGTITDTINDETYEFIQDNKDIVKIVPIATGDNYKGSKIIGTTFELLDGKNIKDGEMFQKAFDIVIGYNLSQKYNLKVGDKVIAAHGASEESHTHENSPYVITGILEKTHTIYDDTLFTLAESVWNVHGESNDTHEHHGEYTALLLKSKNPGAALKLIDEINELPGVLAINPSTTLRKVMENIDTTTVIVYVLCAVIAVMSFVIIFMINLMVMQDLKKDIVLMRLLGLKRSIISKIVIIQSIIVSFIAIVLSFIFTRIALYFTTNITISMGVIMNSGKVYLGEYIIMGIVLIVSVLPIIISLLKLFRRELGDEK